MRSQVTLGPLDLRVLGALRDSERRWLTRDQIAAALEVRDSARDRTALLASLSWMARGRQALVVCHRELGCPTAYALTTCGESELAHRAQTRLGEVA